MKKVMPTSDMALISDFHSVSLHWAVVGLSDTNMPSKRGGCGVEAAATRAERPKIIVKERARLTNRIDSNKKAH